MNIIVTLIVGGIVGWLASIVMRSNSQMGIVANVVIGVVGALLGNWLASAAGLGVHGQLAGLAVAVAGSAILIGVLRALGVFRQVA